MEVKAANRIVTKYKKFSNQHTILESTPSRELPRKKFLLTKSTREILSKERNSLCPNERNSGIPNRTAERGYSSSVEKLKRETTTPLRKKSAECLASLKYEMRLQTEPSITKHKEDPTLSFLTKVLNEEKVENLTEDLLIIKERAKQEISLNKNPGLTNLIEFLTELNNASSITETLKQKARNLHYKYNKIIPRKPLKFQAEEDFLKNSSSFTAKKIMQMKRLLSYGLLGQDCILAFLIIHSDIDTSIPLLRNTRHMSRELFDFFKIYISKPGIMIQNIRKFPFYIRTRLISKETILRAKEIYERSSCQRCYRGLKELQSLLYEIFKLTDIYKSSEQKKVMKRKFICKEDLTAGLSELLHSERPMECPQTEISILETTHLVIEEDSKQEASLWVLRETIQPEIAQDSPLFSVYVEGPVAEPIERIKRSCNPFETNCKAKLLQKFFEQHSKEAAKPEKCKRDIWPSLRQSPQYELKESQRTQRKKECEKEKLRKKSLEVRRKRDFSLKSAREQINNERFDDFLRRKQTEETIALKIFREEDYQEQKRIKTITSEKAKRELRDDLERSHRKSELSHGSKEITQKLLREVSNERISEKMQDRVFKGILRSLGDVCKRDPKINFKRYTKWS